MNNFSNYDPKIISIYEILGSYFTDILFNHIYLMSKNTKSTNLIDEYVKNVQNYVSGIKNNIEYYNKSANEIHQYFLKMVGRKYMDLKFADFISRIVLISVPPDQFSKLSFSDKEDIFSNIICELMSNVSAFVTNPEMIQLIVVQHNKNSKITIRTIQDNAVNFLIEKRAILHNAFVKNIGEVKEHTAVAYTEDLKKSLKKAIKEKNDAIAELEDALDELDALKKKNHTYKKELEVAKSTEAKLRKFIELLNIKSEKGAAAAANYVRQPQQDNIAESNSIRPYAEVPKKENIAEVAKPSALNNFFTKPIKIAAVNATPVNNTPTPSLELMNNGSNQHILDNIISSDEIPDNYLNLLS